MATWPANGETAWNTKMLAYLAIEHNTDGTHATKWPINGTGTRIYTKYLTGTLDADSSTSVAHGITGVDNILSVTVSCYETGTSAYRVAELFVAAEEAGIAFAVRYDGTNIIISSVGTEHQDEKYRIKIDYIV